MNEVLEFLKASKVFFMATASGDEPKVRPLGFVMEYEGQIYFGVGRQKDVYKQMKANPKVEITAVSQDAKWVRLHGSAVFDERPEVFEAAVLALPVLKDMYGDPAGPRLGAFYLEGAEAVFYDMQGNARQVAL
ncbi:MAG: pyridoxamine 5'-phosphate oxidase family protein [Candidatus Adiutrix sp.]|jgi:uncharacterized pyridoxamine 5'-phosphate oxidase family protein|nr:pyridoxamine 5'-phosphate oxidase family protein [Candidatus Adiutrix sp.]